MSLLITDAGITASIRAGGLGISYKIAEISIGTEGYTPTADQTTLRNEVQRKAITRGEVAELGQLHFETTWDGDEAFEGKELGYWLDDGTLFAVDSRDGDVLTYKQRDTVVTEACELNLAASIVENISVELIGPPNATLARMGIVQLSNQFNSESESKAVTEKALKEGIESTTVPSILMWAGESETIPSTHTELDGKEFDINLFPKLARLFPDGTLPDTRGMMLKHAPDGRAVLSFEAEAILSHEHSASFTGNTLPPHNHYASCSDDYNGVGRFVSGGGSGGGNRYVNSTSAGTPTGSVQIHASGSQKNLVDNIAVKFIIRKV